jgi:hypothetical protein
MGTVSIDIPEALTATETPCAQSDVSDISPVAAIVRAVEVERVERLAAPVKDELEEHREGRQGSSAADEESAPDERTDLAQDDTQLIDTRRFRWLTHRLSVAQCAVSLKVSPRYLALSYPEHPDTVQPVATKDIHANHLEAFHTSLRRRCATYRRQTNMYAKNTERLQERLDVYWIVHNFVRVHFTTRQVPAVALGILDHGFTLHALFLVQKVA